MQGATYHYVVEAEDGTNGTGCEPLGANNGGRADRECAPAVTESTDEEFPDGVYTTLFVSHVGDEVEVEWLAARPLLGGETYRLLKALDRPTAVFSVVNGFADMSRRHVETDPSSPRQFFDLRVANACAELSVDEYPPTHELP